MSTESLVKGRKYLFIDADGISKVAIFNRTISLPNDKTGYCFSLCVGFANLTAEQVESQISESNEVPKRKQVS